MCRIHPHPHPHPHHLGLVVPVVAVGSVVSVIANSISEPSQDANLHNKDSPYAIIVFSADTAALQRLVRAIAGHVGAALWNKPKKCVK